MIICDRCKKTATFNVTVDYLGNKNFERIDLCDDCFNRVVAFIKEPEKSVNPQATPGPGRPRKLKVEQ